MPAEVDTQWLISHIDQKFEDADSRRSEGFGAIHGRLNTLAKDVADHDARIKAIEKREDTAAANKEGRAMTAIKILLSGGTIAGVLEFLRQKAGDQ